MLRRSCSLMLGGIFVLVLLPDSIHGEIIADSVADWDASLIDDGIAEQRYGGWRYGYFDVDHVAASHTSDIGPGPDMMYWTYWYQDNTVDEDWWIAGGLIGGAAVGRTFHVPGFWGDQYGKWAVRRWVAEKAGTVRIFGSVKGSDWGYALGGDGVSIRFYYNGTELTNQTISIGAVDTSPHPFQFELDIGQVGDILDFAVDDNANPDYDMVNFNITIDSLIPEPTTITVLAISGVVMLLRPKRRLR